MPSATKKGVGVHVTVTKAVPDICVVMDIPLKVSWCTLNCLKSNDSLEGVSPGHVEKTALAYAVFECIREKLAGSPLETSKSKISSIRCSSTNKCFLVGWNSQGSLSVMRKNCAIALSCLAPHKLYSKYADNMKVLGVPADKGAFNSAVAEMAKAIKNRVSFVVVGRIKIDNESLGKAMDVIIKKLPEQKVPAASQQKPMLSGEATDSPYPSMDVTGAAGYLTADYINSKANGMAAAFTGSKVIVYSRSWESKRNALLKDSILNSYIDLKFKRLKDKMSGVVMYHYGSRYCADAEALKKLGKLSAGDIKSMIKKTMK